MKDFISTYLSYTDGTEPPKIYHRWSLITATGALLGRNYYIPFGHARLYPNFFCMLLGEPGAKKSTPIKLVKRLISDGGYDTFAADRSSREKFLLDLAGVSEDELLANGVKRKGEISDVTEINLWGELGNKIPKEVFIVADEWNDFVSAGNIDFYTTLGTLWDFDDEKKPYEDKVKNSKSVSIYQPTISILGGNTQENFARAFPPEILGHGFLSRLLIIHGEPTGRKIAFPEPPTKEATEEVVTQFNKIFRLGRKEVCKLSDTAKQLITEIYNTWSPLNDPRFRGYSNRRHTHFLKLCIITSVLLYKEEIDEEVVVYANTMLTAIEATMPRAIGEFGKSKTSDVANKIMDMLSNARKPLNVKAIWAVVHKDLDRLNSLNDILQGLVIAEKVQYINGKGWLPKKDVKVEAQYVDWSLLSEEERNLR